MAAKQKRKKVIMINEMNKLSGFGYNEVEQEGDA